MKALLVHTHKVSCHQARTLTIGKGLQHAVTPRKNPLVPEGNRQWEGLSPEPVLSEFLHRDWSFICI